MDDSGKLTAMASQGPAKAEAEGLLGRKMTEEERRRFDGTKAALKLKRAQPPPAPPQDRMPSLKERYTAKQVEDSIRKCDGRWAAMVRDLNCSYDQLRVWMAGHKAHAELADSLREAAVHEAEQVIWDMLRSPYADVRKDAAKFVLQTLGRSRGWGRDAQVQVQAQAGGQVDVRAIFGV